MNELAVNQVESMLRETEVSESALKLQQQKTIIALSLLTGQNLQRIERSEYNNAGLINIDTSADELEAQQAKINLYKALFR